MPPSPITSTSVYRPAMTVPIPSPVVTRAARGVGAFDAAVVASESAWSIVAAARSGRNSPVASVGGVEAPDSTSVVALGST